MAPRKGAAAAKGKSVSRSTKAGLQFPVGRIARCAVACCCDGTARTQGALNLATAGSNFEAPDSLQCATDKSSLCRYLKKGKYASRVGGGAPVYLVRT